jgi:hypothetical protein
MGTGSGNPSAPPPSRAAPVAEEEARLIADICDFLRSRPEHRATTAEMVGQFQLKLGPDKVPVFKSMLRGIADFHRSSAEPAGQQVDGPSPSTGQATWRLKAEFI